MTCDGENCFLDYKPTKKFAWLQTITLKGYRCSVSVRVIHGNYEDTKLFKAVDHPCRAKDLECLMSDSIIVWDSSVINTCQYEFLGSNLFIASSNDLLISPPNFFVLNSQFNECYMDIFGTNEGFYLASNSKATNLP